MKKMFMLFLMVFALVACGEKFPYTSKSEKVKILRDYQEALNKFEETNSEKDMSKAYEKLSELLKIANELEERSSNGDTKALKEIEEWTEVMANENFSF